MLSALSDIGTAAMLWVGGGILLHGLEELHILEAVPARRPRHGPRALARRPVRSVRSSNGCSTPWRSAVVGPDRRRDHRRRRPPLREASGRTDRRLVEVQPPVAAAEIEQGIEVAASKLALTT